MGKNKILFHSALFNEEYDKNDITECEYDGDRAVTVDIVNDVDKLYSISGYDVIYIETAWEKGYETFANRAKSNSRYRDYIYRINDIIRINKCPIIILSGKRTRWLIESNDKILVEYSIHKYMAVAYLWNIDRNFFSECNTNIDIINKLADKYNVVWDFCAGYGNTARIFKSKGKHFISSDSNSRCITYIANEIMGVKSEK